MTTSAPIQRSAAVNEQGPGDPGGTATAPTTSAAHDGSALEATLAEVFLGTFEHELSEPVTSIALGQKRHAALGADAWLSGKGGLEKIPLPRALQPSGPGAARIFFGRDDLPRIMGVRSESGSPAQLYARYREGRWRSEKAEVGRLLQAPPRPLWGVLGHADPEVACKQDDVCIIKRLTGWKTIAAGPGTPLVELQGGVAWALQPDRLTRLEADERWVDGPARPPFQAASGFCAIGNEIWVSEASAGKLHRSAQGTWTTVASPVREPRGLWCPSPTDIWLAAGAALAHFDGEKWARVKGVQGPVSEVRGRGADLWIGGETGVWSRRAR